MSVACEICGKEFKNTQGLRGHMNFVHGQAGSSKILSAPAATEQPVSRLRARLGLTDSKTEPITEQLSNIENRLDKLERITGVKELSVLDRLLATDKPITEQLEQHTHQLTDLSNKIIELSDQLKLKYEDTASNSELNRLADDFADIKKTLLDIKYVEGAYAGLDDELAAIEGDREAFRQKGELDGYTQHFFNEMAEKAKQKWGQTATVNELEKRLTQLEQQSTRVPEEIKLAVNNQVNKEVVPAIDQLIDKITKHLNTI
jgi:hypothetical protein